MNNEQIKNLCLSLMKADTESQVIALLQEAGYWNNRDTWRYYGDYENNYNTIGNQQSRPDAALVEKLINSVDARLMNGCLVQGIDPEDTSAPEGIREAVAQFFEKEAKADSLIAGRIKNWLVPKRTQVARGITLAATGATPGEGNPCFIISDCGEGQTPEMIPETFVSLTRSNKLRIPFVQGKYNMGGTGVLKFCGYYNLQLILSRRNPAITKAKQKHPSDSQWGFAVVRREDPEGGCRNSIYTYLAPVGMENNPRKGGVLRFSADKMPIFPDGRNAYGRESEWGSLIKLYEYSITGYKSHILRRDGAISRIDLLLPDVALPIRLHECRSGYRGHKGSFETTLTGLSVRLEDDRANNIEQGFPSSARLRAAGEEMVVTIYAFKKGKAETYRKNEGIIFTLNGQTHGYLTTDFYRRKGVGFSYLADSILVIVDCTNFSVRAREDLFMNSRDRLSGGDLRLNIENALEDLLRNHEGLRALKERRRREEIESKLEDSKPLEDVLKSLLKKSPTLSTLFLLGQRISTPFKTVKVHDEDKPFEGKRHPTYFKFRGKEYGDILYRESHINMRARVSFETDAENYYFSREEDKGEFLLTLKKDNNSSTIVSNYVLNLQDGIATLSVSLPENCSVGDKLHFEAVVTDSTRIDPFKNSFVISIKEATKVGGGPGRRKKPPSKDKGEDREIPTGIQIPKVTKVHEDRWKEFHFDKYSALKIKHAGYIGEGDNNENGGEQTIYDFFVNVDNVYLKSELKSGNQETEITEARFVFGLVLLGLGLIHYETKENTRTIEDLLGESSSEVNIEDKVANFSKAVAPIILPMIESLGALELDSAHNGVIGEAI